MTDNQFHPDWDQIKPFHDRIAELETGAKQALAALNAALSDDRPYIEKSKQAITALRQALSASVSVTHGEQPRPATPELEAAVNDALGLTAQQKPAVWRYKIVDCFGRPVWTLKTPKADTRVLEAQPLYTHPPVIDKSAAIRIATALGWEPKREWVGLTDEEVIQALNGISFNALTGFNIAEAIEAKLKEKNCG